MKLVVLGATGLVGSKIIQILEEQQIPISELLPVASLKSEGKTVRFKAQDWTILSPEAALARAPEMAIFSAGASLSLQWAPRFAAAGCTVIDNSSAWRMDPKVPLVIPEINASAIQPEHKIIANPNCSTIQMLMALAPLHARYRIKRIVVSTYQSVTGSGQKGMDQLLTERAQANRIPNTGMNNTSTTPSVPKAYPHPIDLNLIPHIDLFLENDYTKEEMKMVHETHKILNDYTIAVSPTAVRVPVMGGHSESINVSFHEPFEMEEVLKILKNSPGLMVEVLPRYPMPLYCVDKDEVFVGRIRRDPSAENTLNMWVVADNIRKGAATNAVQIVEYLILLH